MRKLHKYGIPVVLLLVSVGALGAFCWQGQPSGAAEIDDKGGTSVLGVVTTEANTPWPQATASITPTMTLPPSVTARAEATERTTPSSTTTASRLTEDARSRRTTVARLLATSSARTTATAGPRLTGESRIRRTATAHTRATEYAMETATAESLPTSTPVPPEDDVAFVADITIPDHTVLGPGESFTKTWRIRNTGSGDWGSSYRLEFVSGNRLDAPEEEGVPPVGAGEEADVTMRMSAPTDPGTYTGLWRVIGADGKAVGDQLLSVVIQVPDPPEPTVEPTPSIDFTVIKQDVRPVFVNGGCNWEHNIYVTVIDKYGNPLDGLIVGDTYDNLELPTGSKGPGRVDFDLWGNTYELYVKRGEDGTPYRSAVTRRLSSSHPEIGDMINGGVCSEATECQDKLDRMSFCFGHYAYDVVFQRTW